MNAHEAQARAVKAFRIATTLAARGYTAADAADLDAQGRFAAARLAGQREPSERTWALAVEMLRQREAGGDMFEGLGA